MTKKTWTKEDIIVLLSNNDNAVGRALVRLNERQTADEQKDETTRYKNGAGFRPCHARMGSSMSKWFEGHGYLTSKQAAYWRKRDRKGNMRIGIYAGQLMKVIENS